METVVYNVTIFGINLKLKPVAFTIGGWSVYWYGIIIALGFALALVYAWRNSKRLGVNFDRLLDVVIVTVPLAILSARAYYLIFDPNGNGITSFKQFFGLDGKGFSGLAIYGGVIGAVVVGGIMCYIRKVNVLCAFDIASVGFLIGQGIGRWGNFMNQEAFGSATGSSWWGMTSENVAAELGEGVLAHPCFLYESIWCLGGAVLLHFISKKRAFKGEIALCYCVWYGAGRTVIEGLRTDSLYLFGSSIRVSQALSALLVIFGAVMLTIGFKKRKTEEKDARYHNVFGEMSDTVIAAEGVDTGNAIDTDDTTVTNDTTDAKDATDTDDAVGADGTGETDGVGESDETDETSQNEKAE